jgi:hypothetical protein
MTDGVVLIVVWLTGVPFISTENKIDATTFSFILNSGSTNPALVNEDILKFNYARRTFVSRACGFKTIYLDPLTPYVLTDAAIGDQNGFNTSQLKKQYYANENETHLEIYF